MQKIIKISVFLFMFIFVVVSLLFSIQSMIIPLQNWNPATLNQDAKTLWGKRILSLAGDLPETGMIGYISEQDIPGQEFDPIDTNEEYVLTQYFLLPRKVIQGTDYEYVIANFGGIENLDIEKVERLSGLSVTGEYGNGLYILEGRK